MTTCLAVSPHLDDVAFSAGGTVIALAERGWRVVLATAFTASVPSPTGFALECQLDKGLGADVDYLALRRGEDERFAERAGVADLHWLDHPEAPHRGYGSAPELFAGRRADDEVGAAVADDLRRLLEGEAPDLVLAPQALGGHVDHVVVAAAVEATVPPEVLARYRDTPYAMRSSPAAPADDEHEAGWAIDPDAKAAAVAAYASQLGFQFGGEAAMREALRHFAAAEGDRTGLGAPAEAFLLRA